MVIPKIGKKYWHPEFGYVTYEGKDRTGLYHLITVRDEGVSTITTLDSITLLFDKPQKFSHDERGTAFTGKY